MRIVVAMSGGVDSSVAAALLVEEGHDVIGVHMKLHDTAPVTPVAASAGHCCGLDDAMDARAVAERLAIPFYVMNLSDAFRAAVMDNFAQQYLAGATPNPCVQCNGVLKFDLLMRRAAVLGADALATGHYCRTDGEGLRTAADPAKDQSYFLFPIRKEVLPKVRFPLGGFTKPEVRAHAERLGLVTAQKPESMEVCFLPDDDHTRFVSAWARERSAAGGGVVGAAGGGAADGAGDIVDESGAVLGTHDGYYRYTVGQRRGIGIPAATPLYVLRVEATTRRVVVGPADRLRAHTIRARAPNWFRTPAGNEKLYARIRHHGALHPCTVENGETLLVRLEAPARAVAPGQAVVFYATPDETPDPANLEVVGGAWIVSAEASP